jgi:porphobilinogen synthase
MATYPNRRLRRLRRRGVLRDLLAEVRLDRSDLIAPLFVRAGSSVRREIPSMPGQYQCSVDTALETAKRWQDKGLSALLLFGIPESKDEVGSGAWQQGEAVQQLAQKLKTDLPDLLVFTDVCLCEYTSHGHCGPLTDGPEGKTVDNDAAVELLARTAVSHARAGADVVAPSAMMDGQVRAIRAGLDQAGFQDVAILSYAVKFASAFYGPFRDAADSAPSFGDRRSYQMDYRSPKQILPEALGDVQEGADMLMVKPAGAYLDVIRSVADNTNLPLAAYQVSGEYAMIRSAGANGWLDETAVALESVLAIRRAGADAVITYFAETLAESL